MSTEQADHQSLRGLRILIVEDMGLVADELKWIVEESGCVVAGMAARLEKAESLARTPAIDGVLLDLSLAGQLSYSVAEILRERGVPFIFLTGYASEHLRPDFAGAPHLHKPFGSEALEKAMRDVFAAAGDADD